MSSLVGRNVIKWCGAAVLPGRGEQVSPGSGFRVCLLCIRTARRGHHPQALYCACPGNRLCLPRGSLQGPCLSSFGAVRTAFSQAAFTALSASVQLPCDPLWPVLYPPLPRFLRAASCSLVTTVLLTCLQLSSPPECLLFRGRAFWFAHC